DHQVDATITRILPLDDALPPIAAEIFKNLEARAATHAAGLHAGGNPEFKRSAWMRHVGQGYEIRVDLPAGAMDAAYGATMRAAFLAAYQREYGYIDPDAAIEITDWYVVTTVTSRKNRIRSSIAPVIAEAARPHGRRMAYFPEAGGMVSSLVVD